MRNPFPAPATLLPAALVALAPGSRALPGGDPILLESARLVPADAAPFDQLGAPLDLWGARLALGARGHDEAAANAGAVYVFALATGVWSEEQELLASDAEALDLFGSAVALEGDRLVAGAPRADGPGLGFDEGAAYVFERVGGSWSESAILHAGVDMSEAHFGEAVALAGSRIAVGAPLEQAGGSDAGAVWIFAHDGATWGVEQRLVADDPLFDRHLGSALALDDQRVVVGAPGDSDLGNSAGAAYVFARSGTTWSLEQKLLAPDGAAGDALGSSVALSGDTLALGAPFDQDGGFASGSAHVFVRVAGAWTHQAKLVPRDAAPQQAFGLALALEGDELVVGAPWHDAAGAGAGAAYRFVRSGTSWSERQLVSAADAAEGDSFGQSVALDAGRAAVAAVHGGPLDTGAAHVLEPAPSPFSPFCDGSDGALAACACGAGLPDSGCENAQATGGVRLVATSFAPARSRASLYGSGFPPGSTPTVVVLRAATLEPAPVAFGDGLRCVGLPVVRVAAGSAAQGGFGSALSHGAGPGSFHYQLWYRNAPASFCAPEAFNASGGLTIAWP